MPSYVRMLMGLFSVMLCMCFLSCCGSDNSYYNFGKKEEQLKNYLKSMDYNYTCKKDDDHNVIYSFEADNKEYDIVLNSRDYLYEADMMVVKDDDLEWEDVEPIISIVNVISSKQYEKKDVTEFFDNENYVRESTDSYYCKYKNFDFFEHFIFEYSKFIDTKNCSFSVVGKMN